MSRADRATRPTPVHVGRTTQVWDAIARDEATDKMLATFRCTQLALWD